MIAKKSGYTGFLLMLLVLHHAGAMAQPGGRISIKSDTAKSEIPSHTLYGGGGYGNNMIYLGSTVSGNLPFEYATVAYGFKNALYASVSGIHLQGIKPFGAFYIGALNYSHTFNSWFDLSADFYRYQVASSLTDSLFNSFIYSGLTLGFDWRLLYTRISAGGLFSTDNTAFFQVRNSRYFQTRDIFNGKANISFDPYVNMLFGTLIQVETETETAYTYSQPGRKWKYGSAGQTTNTYYTDRFGLLEMDFGLPVALNTDRFTIEAEADYVLPMHYADGYTVPKGFVVMLNLFFRIF